MDGGHKEKSEKNDARDQGKDKTWLATWYISRHASNLVDSFPCFFADFSCGEGFPLRGLRVANVLARLGFADNIT